MTKTRDLFVPGDVVVHDNDRYMGLVIATEHATCNRAELLMPGGSLMPWCVIVAWNDGNVRFHRGMAGVIPLRMFSRFEET